MRLVKFALLAGLTGVGAIAAADSRGKFAGTWTMDPARSESAHQDVPVESATLVIAFTDSEMTMETTRSEHGKPFHESLHFKLDGSETTTTGDSGVPVTGKARWEGSKLVVETVRNIQDSTVTTLYVHSLSPNGRDLLIDKTLTVQHGYQGQSAPTTGHGKDIFVRAPKARH
jgi:hypothetical protein